MSASICCSSVLLCPIHVSQAGVQGACVVVWFVPVVGVGVVGCFGAHIKLYACCFDASFCSGVVIGCVFIGCATGFGVGVGIVQLTVHILDCFAFIGSVCCVAVTGCCTVVVAVGILLATGAVVFGLSLSIRFCVDALVIC
jgi:hypothetical protein